MTTKTSKTASKKARSIAAYRAHLTRVEYQLVDSQPQEREALFAQARELEAKIKQAVRS